MDQHELLDALHQPAADAQRQQNNFDAFGARAHAQGEKVAQQMAEEQMWHGQPAPIDWTPILAVICVIAVIVFAIFARMIATQADRALVSSLAIGVRSLRKANQIGADLKRRAIEKAADRP